MSEEQQQSERAVGYLPLAVFAPQQPQKRKLRKKPVRKKRWIRRIGCEACGREIVLLRNHFRCPYCRHLHHSSPQRSTSEDTGLAFTPTQYAARYSD